MMTFLAQADIDIKLNTKDEVAVDKVLLWVHLANKRELKDPENGCYNIILTEKHEDCLCFYAYSDRSENLDWQLENFSTFIFEQIKEVNSFQSFVWITNENLEEDQFASDEFIEKEIGHNWIRQKEEILK